MKKLKNQAGITLVALVVTIIILLILASVSLSLVSGSRGIMTRATNAVSTNESATAAEQAELKLAEIQNDYYEEYYVKGSSLGGKTMTQYVVEKANTFCANSRYYMSISEGDGQVNVSVGKDGPVVAWRKYDKTSDYFTWQDEEGEGWHFETGR